MLKPEPERTRWELSTPPMTVYTSATHPTSTSAGCQRNTRVEKPVTFSALHLSLSPPPPSLHSVLSLIPPGWVGEIVHLSFPY